MNPQPSEGDPATQKIERYRCRTCKDWRTLVRPGGLGEEPCPDCTNGSHISS